MTPSLDGGRVLPNFVIVGAMKAGTTSLYQYIGTHPAVFMAQPKEIDFFNRHWDNGRKWYEDHFRSVAGAEAVGEVSANYAKAHRWPETARRMASLIPEARLIYVLREPVERMRSHYQHHVVAGEENRGIDRALRETGDVNTHDYHNTSRYAFQLEEFLTYFAREQILVTTAERLRDHRPDVLRQIFEFLGVDGQWTPPNITHLAHRTSKKIVYHASVERIRHLTGYRALAGHIPLNWKQKVHRLLSASPAPVRISEELRAYLQEVVVQPDLLRLRPLVDLPEIEEW